jgi:hypothetical protein
MLGRRNEVMIRSSQPLPHVPRRLRGSVTLYRAPARKERVPTGSDHDDRVQGRSARARLSSKEEP